MITISTIRDDAFKQWVGKKIYWYRKSVLHCGVVEDADAYQLIVGNFAVKSFFLTLEDAIEHVRLNVVEVV